MPYCRLVVAAKTEKHVVEPREKRPQETETRFRGFVSLAHRFEKRSARIVAATNRDLRKMVDEKQFRSVSLEHNERSRSIGLQRSDPSIPKYMRRR